MLPQETPLMSGDCVVVTANIESRLKEAASLFRQNPVALRDALAEVVGLIGRLDRMTSDSGNRCRLAPWQQRRVDAYIEAHLENTIRIDCLAAVAGLSESYFFRAFRGTFAVAPHRYVMAKRIERARYLLSETRNSLAEIAAACGFSDQAHLTRVFSQTMGLPPGLWRRQLSLRLEDERETHANYGL